MWDKAAVIANYLLVSVGIIGTIIAVSTLKRIERQTKAAEDAAKSGRDAAMAALRQAKHTETTERAWLVIRSSMDGYVLSAGGNPEFWWSVMNAGDTPARLTETQCHYDFIPNSHLTALPLVPNYPKPIILNGTLLAPGASSTYSTFLVDAEGSPEPT